jgi:hypothetical protein
MSAWKYTLVSDDKTISLKIESGLLPGYSWTSEPNDCMATGGGSASSDGGKWTLNYGGKVAMVLFGKGKGDKKGDTGKAHGEGVDMNCPYDWDWTCTDS